MELDSPAPLDSGDTLLSPAAPTMPHTRGQAPSPSSSAQSGSTSEGVLRANNRAAIRGTQPTARQRASIWEHFLRTNDYATTKRVMCKHCDDTRISTGSSTTTMWNHMRGEHPNELDRSTRVGATAAVYTNDTYRKALVEWIISDSQPFTAVESPAFRKAARILRPDAEIPSANTIKREVMLMFSAEKSRVRTLLHEVPGKLSLTVDAWASENMEAFLGITTHWIDSDWRLQTLVLDVAPLSGPHSGENMWTVLERVLTDFDILPKLLAVTTDNASNNSTLLARLEDSCNQRDIPFSVAQNRVRCAAHAINLAVQALLHELKAEPPASEDDCLGDGNLEASVALCVPRLRRLVVQIRASPQRRERLALRCEALDVKVKSLVADMPVRWNSTFAMLKRALELRMPIECVVASDRELRRNALSEDEWALLEIISQLLEVFDRGTKVLCAESHPTLPAVMPVYNGLMKALEDFCGKYGRRRIIATATKAAMDKLQEYYSLCDTTVGRVATILDPRMKLDYYRRQHSRSRLAASVEEEVREVFRSHCESGASSPATGDGGQEESQDDLAAFLERPRVDRDDELRAYLSSPASATRIGVLQWWKTHAAECPCLAAMARDYLAIPATSASVERVFSGGAHLVSPSRGSMSAETIEASMCLKSWLKQLEHGRRPPWNSSQALF